MSVYTPTAMPGLAPGSFPMSAIEARIAALQDAAARLCEFDCGRDGRARVVDNGRFYEGIVLCDECFAERES